METTSLSLPPIHFSYTKGLPGLPGLPEEMTIKGLHKNLHQTLATFLSTNKHPEEQRGNVLLSPANK
jgi:hypothetical protein